ncbi:hypothetical protein HYX02_06715 [Candidatus Woesearchaeota archaeon]|nr:hypothetical protein [Candidatus Woesearchaeota archaeon]
MEIRRNLIKTWISKSKKGYETRDGIGGDFQFAEILINCWISFEAYSCLKYPREYVGQRINDFCQDHKQKYKNEFDELPDDLRSNVKNLSYYQIVDMRPNHELDAPKQINDIKNLSNVMGVVYQIRNNLFHGGKDVQDMKDKNVIEHSAIFLYRLLEWIFHFEGYLP